MSDLKIKAIKPIRHMGVEYKPGDEFETADLFARGFEKRGMAEPVEKPKPKPKGK